MVGSIFTMFTFINIDSAEDNAISYIYLSYALSLLDVTKCSLYDFLFAHFVVNLMQNKQTLSYFIDTRS